MFQQKRYAATQWINVFNGSNNRFWGHFENAVNECYLNPPKPINAIVRPHNNIDAANNDQ